MYNSSELNEMQVAALVEIAKELGIKKPEKIEKEDLIYKILDTQAIQESQKKDKPEKKARTRRRAEKVAHSTPTNDELKLDFVAEESSDEKIPANQRDSILLIASKSDILWAVGYRKSTKFGVDNRTKNIVSIQIWEENNEGKSGDPHFINSDWQED